MEDAGEVDLEDMLPVFEGDVFGRCAVDGSGIVDEDIDAAELLFDLAKESFCASGGGEIYVKCNGLAAQESNMRAGFYFFKATARWSLMTL